MDLSEREVQILAMLCEGKRDKEIGRVLGIHYETVRTYIKRACGKLEVSSRLTAALKFDRSRR